MRVERPHAALVLEIAAVGRVRSIALPDLGSVVVGRDPSLEACFDDPSLSRRHAVVHCESSGLFLEDLGSKNGTALQKRLRPNERVVFPVGKIAAIGSLTLRVVRGAGDASATDDPLVLAGRLAEIDETLARVARADLPVLVLGETGVGKDVLARRIHALSPRRDRPFVSIHATALAPSLLESELFGHERGAFTGALGERTGLLEAAHTGTVFLDEVGELPLSLQVKLLRVLENKSVQRVGAVRAKRVDVRFVAATHRDLSRAVRVGDLREDFYQRLAGYVVSVPPLRERIDEILPLARAFLDRIAAGKTFTSSAVARLRAHGYPGNVRELRNIVDRAALLAPGRRVDEEHLLLGSMPTTTSDPAAGDAERARIERALAECLGNQTRAAKLLGISRRTLVTRLGTLGFARPRKPGKVPFG